MDCLISCAYVLAYVSCMCFRYMDICIGRITDVGRTSRPGSTTTRSKEGVVWMCDQVQVTTMTVSRPGDIIGAERG